MKGTILALLAVAVAGLLAVGHTALAHDVTVQNATEISDCDEAIATVNQSDYLICDGLKSFYADDRNKSRFRRETLDCDSTHGYLSQRQRRKEGLDRLWNDNKRWVANECRTWAAKRKNALAKNIKYGVWCKDTVRKAESLADGCEAQGEKVQILYHQHREQTMCYSDAGMSFATDTHWHDVHFGVACGNTVAADENNTFQGILRGLEKAFIKCGTSAPNPKESNACSKIDVVIVAAYDFKKPDVQVFRKRRNLDWLKDRMVRLKVLGSAVKAGCTTHYPQVLKRCYTFAESFDEMRALAQELVDWADKQPWAKK